MRMTVNLHDGLPAALQEVRTRPLFVMRLDVADGPTYSIFEVL
jgi:hypothetical protein